MNIKMFVNMINYLDDFYISVEPIIWGDIYYSMWMILWGTALIPFKNEGLSSPQLPEKLPLEIPQPSTSFRETENTSPKENQLI